MKETEPDLGLLEELVEELIKKNPDEKIIKNQMAKAGLKITSDPIDRINEVLTALHFAESKKVISE